jgi:hypothetical protein
MLVPFSTNNLDTLLYSFFSHATNKSRDTSIFHSVSINISLLNVQAEIRSIGADLQLLSLIVAEVTVSLAETLKVTFVPAFMVFHGTTCMLLKVQSVTGK